MERDFLNSPQKIPPHLKPQAFHSIAAIRRILIVSDAWHPQVNGVVRTLGTLQKVLCERDLEVEVIGPDRFLSVACPTYSEIRLAVDGFTKLSKLFLDFAPDAIHIATEGPLGWTARHLCLKWSLPFTTSYHTRFPEYLKARAPIPTTLSYAAFRRFHSFAERVLVPTASILQQLSFYGFENLRPWTRGVDHALFCPRTEMPVELSQLPRPIHLCVGRIAPEKNLTAFLDLDLPGSKVIVGDGPERKLLEAKYPDALFMGTRKGEELTKIYSAADVFVFPSRTDTFGLVMIEAMACGTPVAAFPVPGPLDVVTLKTGVLMEDLSLAIKHALQLDPVDCVQHAQSYTWSRCADLFYQNLESVHSNARLDSLFRSDPPPA